MSGLISILDFDFTQPNTAEHSFNHSYHPYHSEKHHNVHRQQLFHKVELQETRILAETLYNYISYCSKDVDPALQQEIYEQAIIALVCAAPNNPKALGALPVLEKYNIQIPSFNLAPVHFEDKVDPLYNIYYDTTEKPELDSEAGTEASTEANSESEAEIEKINSFGEDPRRTPRNGSSYTREEFILAYIHYLGHINKVECLAWQRSLPTLLNEHVQFLFDIAISLTDCKSFSEGFIKLVTNLVGTA